MTFVYAGTIPVWKFEEEEEGQKGRTRGNSVITNRSEQPGGAGTRLSEPLKNIRPNPLRAKPLPAIF